LRKVAAVLAWSTFRKVEVYRADQTTSEPGPLMSTANHFGGFLDPVLAMYALPRRPRIIARDVIWKIPVAKQIMNWVGAIPVHKADDRGPGSNDQMFGSCYRALEDGQHILIFPEGITRDEPSIGKVKTGTARIVLGARASGASNISIVPIGIHYEDKAALRSRASVVIAAPIQVDEQVLRHAEPGDEPGPDNRAVVRSLTNAIDERLREAAPDFGDWQEATTLTRASEYTLRALGEPEDHVSLVQRDRLAGLLAHRPDPTKEEISSKLDAYERELEALTLSDQEMNQPIRGSFWRELIARLVIGLVLLPYAILGLLVHLIPFLIVKAVGLARLAPAAMASLKPIAAILSFGITWIVLAVSMGNRFGSGWGWATLLVVPLYGIAAVVLWERGVLARKVVRMRKGEGLEGSALDILLRRRTDLVTTVLEAL
ncbi:MAG: 1-acyl-sn-glycerol-3-phosphate acyltransferase, partial [Acidimicrobiia bacterium]